MNDSNPSRAPRSTILGATGLSRQLLAQWFAVNGLFGRQSDLSADEQAVVQARLQPLRGLPPLALTQPANGRLRALAAFTEAAVRADGEASRDQIAVLQGAGYSAAAASEVARVIGNVRTVFGLTPRPVGCAARLGKIAPVGLAHAA